MNVNHAFKTLQVILEELQQQAKITQRPRVRQGSLRMVFAISNETDSTNYWGQLQTAVKSTPFIARLRQALDFSADHKLGVTVVLPDDFYNDTDRMIMLAPRVALGSGPLPVSVIVKLPGALRLVLRLLKCPIVQTFLSSTWKLASCIL